LLTLWVGACVAVLVFTFIQQKIHDTDLAFLWFMVYLTFPSGFVLAGTLGSIFFIISKVFYDSLSIPGGFLPNLLFWPLFVAVGYYQWFVIVPSIFKRLRKSSK
jgi:hypothetical protein